MKYQSDYIVSRYNLIYAHCCCIFLNQYSYGYILDETLIFPARHLIRILTKYHSNVDKMSSSPLRTRSGTVASARG